MTTCFDEVLENGTCRCYKDHFGTDCSGICDCSGHGACNNVASGDEACMW